MSKKQTRKTKSIRDPEETVHWLFETYGDKLGENLWPWEMERWHELVFCVLKTIGEPEVMAASVRDSTFMLSKLGLLDPVLLANLKSSGNHNVSSKEQQITISTILRYSGFTPKKVKIAITTISEAASRLYKKYDGKIQNYFLKYGTLMLEHIDEDFGFGKFLDAKKAISIWLQNTLNMPLPAPDVLANQACANLGVTYNALVLAANKQDVNVALVDDVLRLHWEKELANSQS